MVVRPFAYPGASIPLTSMPTTTKVHPLPFSPHLPLPFVFLTSISLTFCRELPSRNQLYKGSSPSRQSFLSILRVSLCYALSDKLSYNHVVTNKASLERL